jgi:hypothetical protein
MAVENVPEALRDMVRKPDWYMPFERYSRSLLVGSAALGLFRGRGAVSSARRGRERLVSHFQEMLAEGTIALGKPHQELENWDEDRREIDTIVIHHTSRPPGLPLDTLNAMHLLRLYVPRYQSKNSPVLDDEGNLQPIASGHFNEQGEQVFYGYHHFVRADGQTTRLLADTAIGWHAGNWDINCRSAAICIDDDLSEKAPDDPAISAIAELIHTQYPTIPVDTDHIIGHGEVSKTECPGSLFLKGWKLELLAKLDAMKK